MNGAGERKQKLNGTPRALGHLTSDSDTDRPTSSERATDASEDVASASTSAMDVGRQRQFLRMREGGELDDMEEGSLSSLDGTVKRAAFNAPATTSSHLNGIANEKSSAQGPPPSSLATSKKTDAYPPQSPADVPSQGLTERDKRAMVLLVALYLLQGIPVGLAFGSIPYILRSKLSYSQIGIFTLCTYPYSLKLLWSPIVDSIFSPRIGRRKSWIVPIQYTVGAMLFWLSRNVNQYIDKEIPDVHTLTFLFFVLVFFAATQDIAVDGWALTLLSKGNLSYASTAQTIGLNSGYFLSFTVFLAFNSVEFSNKYFRSTELDYPLVSLSGYLRFGALSYFAVTTYLALMQPEDPVQGDDPDMDLKRVYTIMYRICRLKHVQAFALVHLVSKLGTATNDAVTSLKLLEKGLSKEDLALAVLIDFPFQLIFGWIAARWSTGDRPLRPWIRAMWARLAFAMTAMLLIHNFPSPSQALAAGSKERNIPTYYFLLVVASTVLSSFASTVQFVGISAFHTIIADPAIGGTYMTLLNTVSNLGGTWPRYFVLRGVDYFTIATCSIPSPGEGGEILTRSQECVSEHGKAACADLGGICRTERDGYYITSSICLILGATLLVTFVAPTARRLQALPHSAWRVKLDRQ